jgi:pimeloyl-ACP methyl ester carboxylesterase
MADKREIYYETEGSGPPLMMVHGAIGGAGAFSAMIGILSEGYQCISFDRLGYYRSTHLDRDTTPEEQAAAMCAVHHSVTSEPAWVFGHSSGGNHALAYALFHPDSVRGLVLMEPALYAIYPPEEMPPEVERMKHVAMPLFKQGEVENGWDEFGEAIFGPRSNSTPRPTRTATDLDAFRSFGFDQPMVITWCPSEVELRRMNQLSTLARYGATGFRPRWATCRDGTRETPA